jgi:glucokinase
VTADGDVVTQGIVAAVRANAIRDAARKAVAAAKGKVGAVAIAVPSPHEAIAEDLLDAFGGMGKSKPAVITAGNAAAIAEQWRGAARGAKHVISFSIAEHVTAGVLINGKSFMGAHGVASSIGWLALNPVEREDYRRLGGLEAEVAAAGIVRRFVWRIKSGDDSRVADQVKGDFTKISAADILQGARSGDGVSISVMRDTGKYIGMAVANLATMFDPEIIVLGGIIASSGDVMLEAIRAETARRMMPQQADQIRIVLSTLGDDAVAIGAARSLA